MCMNSNHEKTGEASDNFSFDRAGDGSYRMSVPSIRVEIVVRRLGGRWVWKIERRCRIGTTSLWYGSCDPVDARHPSSWVLRPVELLSISRVQVLKSFLRLAREIRNQNASKIAKSVHRDAVR